jgi:hypothetical protein
MLTPALALKRTGVALASPARSVMMEGRPQGSGTCRLDEDLDGSRPGLDTVARVRPGPR